MKNENCSKELEEFILAIHDWVNATEKLKQYTCFKPIDPYKEPPCISQTEMKEFKMACEEEKLAHENFTKKTEAYIKCRKVNG